MSLLQLMYYGKVIEKAQSMTTWSEKLFAFIKGPGWFPGGPRLSDPMGVPEMQVREKYNPTVVGWINVYTVLHFVMVFLAFDDLSRYNIVSSYFNILKHCKSVQRIKSVMFSPFLFQTRYFFSMILMLLLILIYGLLSL